MGVRAAHIFLAAVISCGTPFAVAQAEEHEHGTAHEASHEYHPNMLGLFLGVTDEGREEEVTLGIEYERRLNRSFGIGVFAEHVYGDLDFWVLGVPFAYHIGQWKLYVAPGVEDVEDESEFLVRIGTEYGIEVGNWEISPQINVDFVDNEEVWVLGVVIGKGF